MQDVTSSTTGCSAMQRRARCTWSSGRMGRSLMPHVCTSFSLDFRAAGNPSSMSWRLVHIMMMLSLVCPHGWSLLAVGCNCSSLCREVAPCPLLRDPHPPPWHLCLGSALLGQPSLFFATESCLLVEVEPHIGPLGGLRAMGSSIQSCSFQQESHAYCTNAPPNVTL